MEHSPARSSIDVGSVIAGTYTIEALIGRGGMGAVFLASHNRLPGKKVAIKVLHAELAGDEIDARFKREAEIASLLSHPNIVHIEDYNVTGDGMPYLVLEYLKGESLAQRLRSGPMSLDQTFSVMRQIGSALAVAHGKGITHRDLKPQNIFLEPSDIDGRSMEVAKVLDFGVSKMRGSHVVKTQESALLGTPQYMAPEQALGQHDKIDERTDIFALGAIVYEMLSGVAAFGGQTIPEVVFKVVYEEPVPLATRVADLPAHVTTAVTTAMAKAAADRYGSVGSFIEGLTGAPISVMRVAKPPISSTSPISSARPASTGKEAFAQTMGSGDHGATPIAAHTAAVVNVDAATVASQNGVPNLGEAGTVASQLPSVHQVGSVSAAQAIPAASSRPRGAMLAAVLIGVAAIAASTFYMVTRESPEVAHSTQPPTKIAKPTLSGMAKTPTTAPEPVATDASGGTSGMPGSGEPGAVTAAGKSSEPHVAAATPTPRERKLAKKPQAQQVVEQAIADDASEGDEQSTVGARLRAAEQALAASQWDVAEGHANFVIGASPEDARPKQKARALVVHAIVACVRNDVETMATDLRRLGSRPALKATVQKRCAKAKQQQ